MSRFITDEEQDRLDAEQAALARSNRDQSRELERRSRARARAHARVRVVVWAMVATFAIAAALLLGMHIGGQR